MKTRLTHLTRPRLLALAVAAVLAQGAAHAASENLTLLHVGDQESWLISAAGLPTFTAGVLQPRSTSATNLQAYGGVDRLAGLIHAEQLKASNTPGSFRSVLTLNAGDAFIPSVQLRASLENPALATAYMGGQDFYDAIAMRRIGFTSATFGNHEFDLGANRAAQFAKASGTTYLSSNLDFSANAQFAALAAAGNIATHKIVTTEGGNKVAIIGATTPILPRISQPQDVGVIGFNPAFTDRQLLDATVPLIQAQIDAARAGGATAVVMVSHLQNFNNERYVVPQLRGLDVVVSGGGHELMSSQTVTTPANPNLLPNTNPAGGNAPAISPYPQVLNDADGNKVLGVTSNFGNRYFGVLDLKLDATGKIERDAAGVPLLGSDTRMQIVSQAAVATAAAANAAVQTKVNEVFNEVIVPVQSYIQGLGGSVIGSTQVQLGNPSNINGAAGTRGSFLAGLRNAESNLGNLVADSLRFVGGTDIALQNGGGIRAAIAGSGPNGGRDLTALDPLQVAPFTNIVVTIDGITGAQLKSLLEHGVGAASPNGAVNGRFPQVAGMQVFYDTDLAVGSRVQRVVLDDGTVLIDNGAVVSGRTVSMSTIDFLANGGDGYPFKTLGLDFAAPTNQLLYGDALDRFIRTPTAEGGLGGLVSLASYGQNDVLDYRGRLIDIAIAVPEPETYALMLAGLGLVGFTARRRAAAVVR